VIKPYLSGNLVGSNGLLVRLFAVAKVVAHVDQGQRNAEPHGAHAEHGGERDGAGGVLAPDEQVDEETEREDDARIENGRQKGCNEV